MSEQFAFTDADFMTIATLVQGRVGIQLPLAKRQMVYGRLTRRLRQLNLSRFTDYIELLESEDSGEVQHLLNAITTNVTSFFREEHHFKHVLEQVVPALIENPPAQRRVRFWSAGCSQGMEAYSLAMTLMSALPNATQWDIKILATDLDTTVLEKGAAATYPASELIKIPLPYQKRFLTILSDGEEFKIRQELTKLVHFKQLNLLESWPVSGPFTGIFCRNVMIYFDQPTRLNILERFAKLLPSEHWLYIGHSENLGAADRYYQSCGQTIYQRNTVESL